MLQDFLRRVQESPEGRTVKRSAEANPPNPGGGQFGEGKRFPWQTDHEVDRFGNRGTYSPYSSKVGERGREEHVGTRAFVGLQASDRVVDVGAASEEIFRASGERKRELRSL